MDLPCPPLPKATILLQVKLHGLGFYSYLGSTIRGALGNALREHFCPKAQPCSDLCANHPECLLPTLYDNHVTDSAGLLPDDAKAPQPYVVHAPFGKENLQQTHYVGCTLFGDAVRYQAQVSQALLTALREHLPKHYACQVLGQLHPFDEPPPPASPQVTVHFATPLQLRHNNELLTAEQFTPVPFVTSLLRRYSSLYRYHAKMPLDLDFDALKQQAASLQIIHKQLRDISLKRYSNRKGELMPMRGTYGSVTLAGEGLSELWPWLWHGQALHSGRLASMGFGRYRLVVD
jgi:hypothetical protein